MSNVKIALISSGVQELLHEIGDTACKEIADKCASECGLGYSSDTYNAGKRTVASVFADSDDAYQDNYDNNTLLKVIGGFHD